MTAHDRPEWAADHKTAQERPNFDAPELLLAKAEHHHGTHHAGKGEMLVDLGGRVESIRTKKFELNPPVIEDSKDPVIPGLRARGCDAFGGAWIRMDYDSHEWVRAINASNCPDRRDNQ